jgi:predicted AAA+ superfamily ATPase
LEQLSQTFNPSQVLYINKEDKAFDVLKNDDDLYRCLENEIKKGKKYIFCDEVQLITHREKAINSVFAKHKNNIDIYLNCIFKYVIS